jgi:RNA polymerase sigma-70 factor (ECF subfamily)
MSAISSPEPLTLAELLLACHQGDATAQHRLYHSYYAFARTVALHYGGNSDEVEDIVQNAFIRLFGELQRESFRGNFTGFFRRLVANQSIDHYRLRSRRRKLFEGWLPDRTSGYARNQAEHDLEAEDIVRFLRQLTPRYRMVFSLFVLEGYTHAEIADRLGISVGTSKSNLARARKKLQRLAGPFFNSPNFSAHE